jgi:hypothetical protein
MVHVEASICKAYNVKKISTFISYYFAPHLRTRINRILKRDGGEEVPLSENLSIFSHLEQPVPKNITRGRYFTEIEFRHVYICTI